MCISWGHCEEGQEMGWDGMGGVCNDEYVRIDWLEIDAVFNFPVEITRFQIATSHGNQKSSVHKKHE